MEAALACSQVKPLTCEMCDNSSPAAIACVECQKRLCAPCQRFHDQVAGTKYHNLFAMETSSFQATEEEASGRQATGLHSRVARKKFCKTHAKQELVFHCCPCDVLICPVCRETSHQGHDTEDLNVASEQIHAQVRDLLEQLEVKVKAVTEVITEVSKTEQDLERQRQAVVSEAVEAAGKVSAWANQAEDNLVKAVNKMADPVKDELRKRKTAAREVNATLVLLQDRAKLAMKAGFYAELQSLRSDLKKSLVSDVTLSLEKGEGQPNPLVHADARNVNSTVNSGGVCMPKDVKTKDTVFFKRRSSGQEILQNTVPKYVGDVTSGQTENISKTTAFIVQTEQFIAACVDLNGEGFSVLVHHNCTRGPCNHCMPGIPWSWQNHNHLMRYNLKGENIGLDFSFTGCLATADRLMQPRPECWLIYFSYSRRLQVLRDTDQYRNEDTGQPTGPSIAFQGLLSNSSPNSHVYAIHNRSSGCVYEIQQITIDPDGNISVEPFFQVVHRKTLYGFDVSADEAYFATVNCFQESVKDDESFNIEVNVYQRLEAQPIARFIKSMRGVWPNNNKGMAFEACLSFSRYKGKEMLRLSIWRENCVYVLDHKKGCTVVHQMTIDNPVFLMRDCRERVWVGLEDNSTVVFET